MRVMHAETVVAALRDGSDPPEVAVEAAAGAHLLVLPESIGGVPVDGATNPEQLFGSAYAGCMLFAIEHAARRRRLDRAVLRGLRSEAAVRIGRAKDGTNRLEVDLTITVPGLAQADAEALCAFAARFCPFHQAIDGNVEGSFRVVGSPD
ncbi:MAG: OsmC family protein [Acidimicrobiia bacterium]